MLTIETTRPLKRHTQLQALVEAVLEADPRDEVDWVEWKIGIDLGHHEGQGTVARHILGMANRDPDAAARTTGGYGYLLVGVEPGSCPGIQPLDPADLEPRIQQFLADEDGPTWQPFWIAREAGTQILVIMVGPPGQGDPMHTLDKQFGKYQAGDVFVRLLGRTEKARPEDIRRLVARAHGDTARQLTVDLTTSDGVPPRITSIDLTAEAIQPWIDKEESDLLAPLQADLRERAGGLDGLARIMRQTNFLQEEPRTPDEYRQQVADYLERAREAAVEVASTPHIERGLARLALVLLNPTDNPFRDVQVTLLVPGEGVAGFDGPPDRVNLPSRPRRWGPRDLLRQAVSHMTYDLRPLRVGRSVEIDNSGSVRFRFPPVNVRPQDRETLDPVDLVVGYQYAGRQIAADWEARSTHVSGVVQGTLIISVEDDPMPAHHLLETAADAE